MDTLCTTFFIYPRKVQVNSHIQLFVHCDEHECQSYIRKLSPARLGAKNKVVYLEEGCDKGVNTSRKKINIYIQSTYLAKKLNKFNTFIYQHLYVQN